MTLNQKSGEIEYQLPTSYHEFDNSGLGGEMYRIKTSEGDLVVSEKHRVYSASKNSLSSFVVKTLTDVCSLKCGSLDQTGQLSSNANAKKGTSVLCEINLSVLSSKECEAFFNSMNSESKEISSRNFSFVMSDLEQIKSEYFDNSSISSMGADNFNLYSFNSLFEKEFDLKKENTMLVSTTNSIYNSPLCFLEMASLSSLPSLMQSLSVNLESLKSSSNFSNISSCFILLENASLAIEDQFNQTNLSILAFNSPGIDKVMLGILTFDMYYMFNMYEDIYHVFKGFGDYSSIPNKKIMLVLPIHKPQPSTLESLDLPLANQVTDRQYLLFWDGAGDYFVFTDLNISINASDLWDIVGNPNESFRFKMRNDSQEQKARTSLDRAKEFVFEMQKY